MKRQRQPRGSSLIEVMMAMLVLSIGILGAMHANVLASSQTGLATREAGASAIGRDLVDSFERLNYDHPALATGQTHSYATDQGTGNRPLLGAAAPILLSDGVVSVSAASPSPSSPSTTTSRYAVTWQVTSIAAGTAKQVDINVTFTTPAGGTKQAYFRTIKFNPSNIVGSTATQMEEGI